MLHAAAMQRRRSGSRRRAWGSLLDVKARSTLVIVLGSLRPIRADHTQLERGLVSGYSLVKPRMCDVQAGMLHALLGCWARPVIRPADDPGAAFAAQTMPTPGASRPYSTFCTRCYDHAMIAAFHAHLCAGIRLANGPRCAGATSWHPKNQLHLKDIVLVTM